MRGRLLALVLVACSADGPVRDGKEALEQHDLVRAETAWRTALRREPDRLDALAGLGWTYHLAGERDAARKAFSRCVEVAPEAAECLRGLASIALAEGQVAIARDLLGRALVASPDDPLVRSSMALLEMTTGDLEAAGTHYEALAARFPNRAEYRLGLAEVRLRQHRNGDAARTVETALALPNTSPRYQAMLWQLHARALIAASAGKEDPERCAATAPAVRAWLDAAAQSIEHASALGVNLPDLPAVTRRLARRVDILNRTCPPEQKSAAELMAPTGTP